MEGVSGSGSFIDIGIFICIGICICICIGIGIGIGIDGVFSDRREKREKRQFESLSSFQPTTFMKRGKPSSELINSELRLP